MAKNKLQFEGQSADVDAETLSPEREDSVSMDQAGGGLGYESPVRVVVKQLSLGAPPEDIRRVLSDGNFDQVYIDCQRLSQGERVVKTVNLLMAFLEEKHIARYEPVVVSIASVPPGERNQIVEFLDEHDIPSVSLPFNRYLQQINS